MHKILSVLALLVVAACTSSQPIKYLYKPGISGAGKQMALDQCRISSFKEIPQTVVSETRGGYYNPGNLQCSSIGGITNCYRVGAVNIPPTTETYDVNAELRGRYIDQCLRGKGFSVTPLMQCKTSAEKKAAADAEARGEIPKCASGTLS